MQGFFEVLRQDLVEAGALFRLYPDQVSAIRELVRAADEDDLFRLSLIAQLRCAGPGVREAFDEAILIRFPRQQPKPSWGRRFFRTLRRD